MRPLSGVRPSRALAENRIDLAVELASEPVCRNRTKYLIIGDIHDLDNLIGNSCYAIREIGFDLTGDLSP